MRCATFGVSVGLRRGQETCCSEMSCTTSTRLCEASATARWNSAPSSVKRAASSRLASASAIDLPQPRDVLVGGVLGGKLGGEAFDGALRVHDLGGADAGEVELHRERLGEQPRIAARHPRAAALAHPDLGDAERLQACAAHRARRSG